MAHQADFRYRGSNKLKDQWMAACDAMRVSQNEAFLALVELFVAQDELTREAMVRRGESAVVTIKERKRSR